MRSSSWLLCRRPRSPWRLLTAWLGCEGGTRLLICVDLVPLSGCRILGTLCLQVGQGRCSCNASSGKSSLDATTRRWYNGCFGRRRRSSLRSHGRCGGCRTEAIHALGLGHFQHRLILIRSRVHNWLLLLLRLRLPTWRWEVLLVVVWVWIVDSGIRTTMALRCPLEKTLFIWGFRARRIWQWLWPGASAFCQSRGLHRAI